MPTGFPMFNVVVVVLLSFLNKRHSYAIVSLFMISFSFDLQSVTKIIETYYTFIKNSAKRH